MSKIHASAITTKLYSGIITAGKLKTSDVPPAGISSTAEQAAQLKERERCAAIAKRMGAPEIAAAIRKK